jgi:hypothetical protein
VYFRLGFVESSRLRIITGVTNLGDFDLTNRTIFLGCLTILRLIFLMKDAIDYSLEPITAH